MSTKYIVYNEKRTDIHKPIYMKAFILKDISDEDLSKGIANLKEKYEVVGSCDTEEEYAKMTEENITQSNREYIPYFEEAVRIKGKRPILVFIDDPLVVNSGFYSIRACDYEELKAVVNIRFVTSSDDIRHIHTILFVNDLTPFRNAKLGFLHCVLKTDISEDQITKWIEYNLLAFRISVKKQDEFKEKIIKTTHGLGEIKEAFEDLIEHHKKNSNLNEQLVCFEFPFEIGIIIGKQFLTQFLQLDA